MDKHTFEMWMNNKYDELTERFVDKNRDQFMEFAIDEFNSYQADYSDYLYDMYKDDAFEREQEKSSEE